MTLPVTWLLVPAMALAALHLRQGATPVRATRMPTQSGGYKTVENLSRAVESWGDIPGFSKFALAVSTRESRGNNLAVNDSKSEARAACSMYQWNVDNGRLAQNPYPAAKFCFGSGGWYGFLPAVAMVSQGFRDKDPYLIFDPKASTALFSDYVRRTYKGYFHRLPAEHRNWLAMRRFMSSIKTGLDYQEQRKRSKDVRARFAKDLKSRGIDPGFMYSRVSVGDYPGALTLYNRLLGQQPRA